MKRLRNLLFAWMFVCCLIPAYAKDIKHKVVFDAKVSIDTIVAADGNTYSVLKFPSCSFSQKEGIPQLPVKIIKLIIPANEEVDKVVWSKGSSTLISLKYPIMPVQKPVRTSIDFEGNEFVFPNKTIYSLDVDYPSETARVIRTNFIRGNKVVIIEVSPVAYNPIKNQMEVSESLEINLQLKSSEKKLKASPVKNKEKFDRYLKALVDNAEDVTTFSATGEKKNKPSTTLKSAAIITGIPVYCEYVIITPSSLASYFNDFITWKKQKGVDIELVTTEQIFQNYIGDAISGINDNAGKIRQFLSEAYNNGLEYALLAGDYNTVPIRYGCGDYDRWTLPWYDTPNDNKIPSDLYFSDFEGDWQIDNDEYTGEEYGDNVDYGSEIFVGRLLCTSGSQIQAWTLKLLQYEKNPGNGSTSYLKKAFYTQADQLQEYDQARDIASRFGSIFTTNTVYEEIYNGVPNYNSTASPQFPLGAQVISEINTGYGFVSWFNHGRPNGIAVGTKGYNQCNTDVKKTVSNYDSNPGTGCTYYAESGNGLDNLSSSNKPFLLYTLACETTPFDTWLGIAPTANLGAMTTIQSGKGGPIYLGNTRYGWVDTSWYLQQAFTNILAGGTYQLGVAEANSKGSSGNHYVWLSHNLVGCPETEMWTNTPSNFTNASAAKCGSNVVVNTGGVTYCTVCVMSSNDNGATYWSVDESSPTQKTFYNVSEPFVVTITKHNYIPFVIQSSQIITNLSTSVTGPASVCSSGTSFSIGNVPSGATITWTKSSNLSMTSAQGSNPCTFSPNGTGSGWIHAQVTTACNNTYSLPNKDVCVDIPTYPVISSESSFVWSSAYGYPAVKEFEMLWGQSITFYDENIYLYNSSLFQDFYWDWSSDYDGTISTIGNGEIMFTPNGKGIVRIRTKLANSCGETEWSLPIFIVVTEGFLMSPNPASQNLTITIEDKKQEGTSVAMDLSAKYTVRIFDNLGTKKREEMMSGKSLIIPINNLLEGNYIVEVNNGKKSFRKQLVVKR